MQLQIDGVIELGLDSFEEPMALFNEGLAHLVEAMNDANGAELPTLTGLTCRRKRDQALHGDGLHFAPVGSFLKWLLVTNSAVRYVGS